jgi:hypothetical protein
LEQVISKGADLQGAVTPQMNFKGATQNVSLFALGAMLHAVFSFKFCNPKPAFCNWNRPTFFWMTPPSFKMVLGTLCMSVPKVCPGVLFCDVLPFFPPLWPPAHRASGPEGNEGAGEIFI